MVDWGGLRGEEQRAVGRVILSLIFTSDNQQITFYYFGRSSIIRLVKWTILFTG